MGDFDYENLGICYWNGTMGSFRIGIIGSGPGTRALLDIIFIEFFQEFLPGMELVAASELLEQRDIDRFREINIPVYGSFEGMLEAHPEINLIVEMTGRPGMLPHLRKLVPESVSIMDHREVVFFCGLHDMAMVKRHYKNDLTQQRVLLQSIIDEIREDIFLLDKTGNVMDMNRIVRERAGAATADLLGKPCWQMARLPDGSNFCNQLDPVCPFHKTLLSGQKEETLVTRINRDGLLQYYRLYAYPILDMHGSMTHVMVMHRDITRRTQREKHQSQRDRLAVVGEMSTYLAHEIRNPLFAIGGFANSLLKSPHLDDKDREKVQILVDETKRLDRMLKSMLNFVRPSQTQTSAVDMVEVCRNAAELMSIGFGGHGYTIDVQCGEKIPPVIGDADSLRQCVINVLKNAIEAMPGGGQVGLRLGLEEAGVAVRITDTGIGMSPQELDKIFNPFYSTKPDGNGLGMPMIKKIVEEYGGRIELSSRPGQGTEVALFLPPVLESPDMKKDQAVAGA